MTLTAHGIVQVAWDDLRFPASGINPAGSAAPASQDVTTYPGTLLFATATNNHVAGVAQMPHTWHEGTAIKPHIHWTKTTADGSGLAVAWEFRYAVANIGDAFGSVSAWQAGTLRVGDLTTLEKHNLTSFPEIDMTGKTLSAMIVWELRRNVANDSYGADARLLEVDFHYQLDGFGSPLEYDK